MYFSQRLSIGCCSVAGAVAGVMLLASNSWAQVVPDGSLGAESSVVNGNDDIEGGAARGGNLFHSFSDFNVDLGQRVYFLPGGDITDIFARVTGGEASQVLGRLGIRGDANLFFVNPNGVFFGPDAELDLNGSLLVSTADAIQFENGFIFSAQSPAGVAPGLLTVNPSALLFGRANVSPIRSQAELELEFGETLQLVGGDVVIEGDDAELKAREGLIELGGLSQPGQVGLVNGALQFAANVSRANVTVQGGADVEVNDSGGGDVRIYGYDIVLEDADIFAGYRERRGNTGRAAGDIVLDAVNNIVAIEAAIANRLVKQTEGQSGDITLRAGGNILLENSQVRSEIIGTGSSGDINITAGGGIFLNAGRIQNDVDDDGVGNAGNIRVVADVLRMETPEGNSRDRQSVITTGTEGQGNGGTINIEVNQLTMIGPGRSGESGIIANSAGSDAFGDAGSISIRVNGPMVMTDRGKIESVVQRGATGSGGNVLIQAQSLVVTEVSAIKVQNKSNGVPGNLLIVLEGDLDLSRVSFIDAFTDSQVPSEQRSDETTGNIVIEADEIRVSENSGINVETRAEATGDGGTIRITANAITIAEPIDTEAGFSTASSGFFSRSRAAAEGAGGDIILTVGQLQLEGNAVINASTESNFEGGDIDIRVDQLELLDGGQIVASSSGDGAAGDVTIRLSGDLSMVGVDPRFATQLERAESLVRRGRISNVRQQISREGTEGLTADTVAPSGIFVIAVDRGAAGNVQILGEDGTENRVTLASGSEVSARSLGSGPAGNIAIAVSDTLTVQDANIRTDSAQSAGGQINLEAGLILLFGDGDIRTNVASGRENGGSIVIEANALVALDDSDILAFARDGRGGDITLPAFFGQDFVAAPPGSDPALLDGNDQVDINASGRLSSGTISFPDVSLVENNLTELPDNIVDPDTLVAGSCIAQASSVNGSLIVTGADGLPGFLPSILSTGTVQSVDPTVEPSPEGRLSHGNVVPVDTASPHQWEPQAAYQLADGRVVLSRDCS